MAKLPDQDVLGPLPNLSVPTGMPAIDLSAVGRGYEKLGEGFQKLSAGIQAGFDAQNDLAEKQAQADFSINQDRQYYEKGQDPDYQNAPDNFRTDTTADLQSAADKIQDPVKKAEFLARNSVGLEHRYNLLKQHGVALYQRDTEDENNRKLDDLATQALANPDEGFRATKLQEARDLIEAENRAFRRTPAQRQARTRAFVERYGEAFTNDLIQRDPQKALEQLNKVVPATDPALKPRSDLSGGAAYLAQRRMPFRQELQDPETRKLVGAIVSAENPGAGPAVVESLFNRTELVNQDRAAKGLPPVTVKDMILGVPGIGGGKSFYGPVRSGAIADHLAKMDNPQFAAAMNSRIDAALDGSNTIQGHTDQGSAGDPNYVTGGTGVNINGERFNNWGYPGSRRFQQDLQNGYASAEAKPQQYASLGGTATDAGPEQPDPNGAVNVPNQASPFSTEPEKVQVAQLAKTGTPLDFLRPDQLVRLKKQAETQIRANAIDAERQQMYADREKRRISDDRENEIIKDLTSDNPTITAKDIGTDDKLTPNARTGMLGLAERLSKPSDKDARTYGPMFTELFHRSTDDKSPNPIRDQKELYPFVGNGLTAAGLDRLRVELAGKKTPEGAAETMMKNQFFTNAKHQISGSDDFTHIKDPKGDELYLQFLAHALPAYQAGREQGLTPTQLLDPDSPNYLGKTVKIIKRSIEQRTADMLSDAAGGSNDVKKDPNAPPVTYNTVGDLVSAVQAGKLPRSEGERIAIERGWAKKPTISDDVQVPMSR